MVNEAWNNAFFAESHLNIGFHTLSLMNSTYPSTISDKSSASYASALVKNSVSAPIKPQWSPPLNHYWKLWALKPRIGSGIWLLWATGVRVFLWLYLSWCWYKVCGFGWMVGKWGNVNLVFCYGPNQPVLDSDQAEQWQPPTQSLSTFIWGGNIQQ